MKILKVKKPPAKKDFTHKERCRKCGSKLLVEYADVYISDDTFRDTCFDCPVCGYRNSLDFKYDDIYYKIRENEQ